MKAVISNKVISNYGGAVPIYKLIKKSYKIDQVIKQELGIRPAQSFYGYDDIIIGWVMTIFCHGYRLIRMADSKRTLSIIRGLKICSHDTVGRQLKKFATKNLSVTSINKKHSKKEIPKVYAVNDNDKLNNLLVRISKAIGLLKEGVPQTLDVDCTYLYSETKDADGIFTGARGYNPMVCMAGKAVVYTSMRNGRAGPDLRETYCIAKSIGILEKNGINVARVRIDGAGYNMDVTNYINSKKIVFIIGADWSERSVKMVLESGIWFKSRLKTSNHSWDAEFTSIPFNISRDKNTYRLIAARISEQDRPDDEIKKSTKWKLWDGYYYKFILTNDFDTEPKDIVLEYHKRGAIEKNFDCLKNDFGWNILPFSNLNENHVHMILTAIAQNIFQAVLEFVSKQSDTIDITYRLERFYREFILASFSCENGKYVFYNAASIYKNLI